MKKLLLIISVIAYKSSFAVANGQLVNDSTGNPVLSSTVSVQSFFHDGETNLCSGVLVAPRIVLTAEHCMISHKGITEPATIKVTFGSPNDENALATHALKAVSPSFAGQDARNLAHGKTKNIRLGDIALVYLSSSAPSQFQPVPIADTFDRSTSVTTVGYGATLDIQNLGVENYATTNIIHAVPYDLFEIRSKDPVATGGVYGGVPYASYAHICQEDSGGPNFQLIDGQYQVIAISTGYVAEDGKMLPSCGGSEYNTQKMIHFIAINVTEAKTREWIMDKINNPPVDISSYTDGADGYDTSPQSQLAWKKIHSSYGLVTPDYYLEHPASRSIDRGTIHCSPSKYSPQNTNYKYGSDPIIAECLGGDMDIMHDEGVIENGQGMRTPDYTTNWLITNQKYQETNYNQQGNN